MSAALQEDFELAVDAGVLRGALDVPAGARAIVLFAHGSGSSRKSPRNARVAHALRANGLGTLLFDLLTADEERADAATGAYRFDVELLAARLSAATDRLVSMPGIPPSLGYFGASTGAAAALLAGAVTPHPLGAIVSRGGRPDLAGAALPRVRAATLLIVGGADSAVLELNRSALRELRCTKQLVVIPGATHLFTEPGTLDAVCDYAAQWFVRHLTGTAEKFQIAATRPPGATR